MLNRQSTVHNIAMTSGAEAPPITVVPALPGYTLAITGCTLRVHYTHTQDRLKSTGYFPFGDGSINLQVLFLCIPANIS